MDKDRNITSLLVIVVTTAASIDILKPGQRYTWCACPYWAKMSLMGPKQPYRTKKSHTGPKCPNGTKHPYGTKKSLTEPDQKFPYMTKMPLWGQNAPTRPKHPLWVAFVTK